MRNAVIVEAVRTPAGRLGGALGHPRGARRARRTTTLAITTVLERH